MVRNNNNVTYFCTLEEKFICCIPNISLFIFRDLSSCYTYFYNNEESAVKDFRTDMEFLHIPFGDNHYKERNRQIHFRSKECSKVVDFLIGNF